MRQYVLSIALCGVLTVVGLGLTAQDVRLQQQARYAHWLNEAYDQAQREEVDLERRTGEFCCAAARAERGS